MWIFYTESALEGEKTARKDFTKAGGKKFWKYAQIFGIAIDKILFYGIIMVSFPQEGMNKCVKERK